MSMNLHAECAGKPIELQQTPTHITRMIMVSSDGPVTSLTGKKARRALYSYIAWVLDARTQMFNSEEEKRAYYEQMKWRRAHVKEVQKFLECADLKVYEA